MKEPANVQVVIGDNFIYYVSVRGIFYKFEEVNENGKVSFQIYYQNDSSMKHVIENVTRLVY